jgi:hypothetical protein
MSGRVLPPVGEKDSSAGSGGLHGCGMSTFDGASRATEPDRDLGDFLVPLSELRSSFRSALMPDACLPIEQG